MFKARDFCPKCEKVFDFECEYEEAGEGEEHEVECENCGEVFRIEIYYSPEISVID